MKGNLYTSKISKFYSVFSIFLIIVMLGGCLPSALAKPASVDSTITPKSFAYAPVANDDTYVMDLGGTLDVPAPGVLGNDTDADNDPLTAIKVSDPAHGTITLNADGSFSYIHDGSDTTSDLFTYKANDGTSDSNEATVNITINPVAPLNNAPVANDESYTIGQGDTLDVPAPGVLGNDTDADSDPLTAIKVSDPAHGTITLNADGSFSYIHDGSDTASDLFTYKANDGTSDSNEATVNITINPVAPLNNAPVANDDSYTIDQGGTLDVAAPGVLGNDTDADNDPLTAIKVSDPAHGTITLNADGSFSYIHDGSDTTSDLFTYKANDGISDSNEATVNITISSYQVTVISTNTTLDAGEYTYQHLIINNNAVLTLNSNSSLPGFKGVRIIADSLTIESGSSISANGKGYGSASGPGAGGSYTNPYKIRGGGGGGYGGKGGDGGGAVGGTAYGSLTEPTDLGSGGGVGSFGDKGGAGGGAVRLDVSGTLTINGSISANGIDGTYGGGSSGGGSGGSIYITTNTIDGNGTISANGGTGTGAVSNSGEGAGGRIAIYYITNSYTGTMSAWGGTGYQGYQNGGAGTIFTKSSAQPHGDLLLDNNSIAGALTPVTGTNEFDSITIRNQANVKIPSGSTLTLTTLNSQAGIVTNNGVVSAPELVLTNINFINNGTLNIPDISVGNAGILEQNSDITLNNLTVLSGGVLTCTTGDNINLTMSNLTIEVGGSIDANGKGYGSASGPGAGGSYTSTYKYRGGGGGGYGGKGGDGSGAAGGKAYGSPTEPTDLGSGGGDGSGGYKGGAGGGAIRLDVAGILTVNGNISANGINGNMYSGGGSGGSIYITTNTIAGHGTISASGGTGRDVNGSGGGAGGRIVIYCSTEFTGGIMVSGGVGENKGEDGTIHVSGLISATEQTSSQSNLTETLVEQTLSADNITMTGNFNGTFTLTNFKMVGVKTGSFANNGFFRAEWQANLLGKDYAGTWQGLYFLNQSDSRIYLKGRASGGILGIIDGYLSESVEGSGIYDRFQIGLQFCLAGAMPISGKNYLNGTVTYQASQEYPSTQLYVLQTSLSGISSGSYSGSLDIVVTHLRVADSNNPYNGQGFSVISYNSNRGSGTGYTYDQLTLPGQVALSGIFGSPLLGAVTGVLNENQSPRTLGITIERIDLGVPPMADLSVSVCSSAHWVSPGETVNYIIEYRNDGISPAENVVVVDELDYPFDYISSTENGIYWPLRHEVFWKLGTLAPGETGYLSAKANLRWSDYAIHQPFHNVAIIDTTSDELHRYLHPDTTPRLNIEEYLSYATITSTTLITEEEFETEMLTNPETSQLYDYLMGNGYTYTEFGEKISYSDDTTVNAAMLALSASDNSSADDPIVFLIQRENKLPIYIKISDSSTTSDNSTTLTLGNSDGEELSIKYIYDPSFGSDYPYRVEITTMTTPLSQYPMSNPTSMASQDAYSNGATTGHSEEYLYQFATGSFLKPGTVFAASDNVCTYWKCVKWESLRQIWWYILEQDINIIIGRYIPKWFPKLDRAVKALDIWNCLMKSVDCFLSGDDERNQKCSDMDFCWTGLGIGKIPAGEAMKIMSEFVSAAAGLWDRWYKIDKYCHDVANSQWPNAKMKVKCWSRSVPMTKDNQLCINGEYIDHWGTIYCIEKYSWSTDVCDWIHMEQQCCPPPQICYQVNDEWAICIKHGNEDIVDAFFQESAMPGDPNVKYGPEGIVYPGEKLDYKVEYENVGEGTAFGVYVTDTLDKDLDDSTLQIGPVIDTETGQNIAGPGIYSPGTRTITWYVGEVGPGQGGYAEFSANVNADAPDGTSIINFATVYFPSGAEVTPTNGIVSIVMRDEPRIKIDSTANLLTTEDGGEDFFAVVLQTQPTADVAINLSSDDPSEGTVSPASLTFTPDNWDQPQMVTVTGQADNVADGDVTYHIITAPALSSDPRYSGLDAADVTVVNMEVTPPDQTPPITQIEITPGANENGWNNSDITVNLTATDNEGGSGVKEIHYQLSGTTQDEQNVPGSSVSLTINTEGTTDLTYYSVDNAGNQEAEQSVTLKLDKTAPSVSITANPSILWPPNNKMVDVLIGGSATDSLAGIASTTFDVTDEYNTVEPVITNFNTTIKLQASREGGDKDGRIYTISVTTKDQADNTATSSTTVICPHDQGK